MTSVHRHDDVRIYHKEAKALREQGYEVTVLCHDFEGVDESGIRFIQVKVPKGRFLRMLVSPFRYARAAKKTGAAYCHFHDPELILAGRKLMKKMKVIYDIHEDVPRQILTKPYLKPKIAKYASEFMEKYERKAAEKFYAIVAAEPVIYDRFASLNRRTVMVCNYPKLSEFTEVHRETSNPRKSICYLGAITELRGIQEMLDAIAGTDVTLILAGDFENEALRSRCEAHRGWKNVEYLGYVGREGVRQVLSEASVGLVTLHPIPKYLTALPVKMFEYMVAEVPVVASNFPYWNDIVEDANCGFCVNPMDPDEIRASVEYILDHPDAARDMGRNGRAKVLEKYNWEREKEKLFRLYPALIDV